MPLDPQSPFVSVKQGAEALLPVGLSVDSDGEVGDQGYAPAVASIDVLMGVSVVHGDGVSEAGAVEIMAADPQRVALTVRNASDTQMRMRVDGEEAGPADYPLDPGRGYEFPPNMVPVGAVSIYCASAGKAWCTMSATRAA